MSRQVKDDAVQQIGAPIAASADRLPSMGALGVR